MSLRDFHIVFVSVCTALFAFLIVWGFLLAADRGGVATKVAVAGLAGLVLMPVYGAYFLRKARRINL